MSYRTGAIITYSIFHCGSCRAVGVTDSLCNKQGNSSRFGSKIRGLCSSLVSNQEWIIMVRMQYSDWYNLICYCTSEYNKIWSLEYNFAGFSSSKQLCTKCHIMIISNLSVDEMKILKMSQFVSSYLIQPESYQQNRVRM